MTGRAGAGVAGQSRARFRTDRLESPESFDLITMGVAEGRLDTVDAIDAIAAALTSQPRR